MASRSKSVFTGFPVALRGFLRQLEKNNNKSWFDAHRDDYESLYLEPAKHFTAAMAPGLKKISSGLQDASWEQSPAPKEMFDPKALDFCLDRFRAMRPVQKWFVDFL